MASSYSATLSLENSGLQHFALAGDDEGAQDAIDAGANVNALDASGRSALLCAISGTQWSDISVSHDESFMTPSRLKLIEIILRRPEISLFSLNAPNRAFNDATPLGMAAWLNMPEAVSVLLQSSSYSVAVDGTDMHGSTPLMYAARDGHLVIVKSLLMHGARPDLRALNDRTAIQYALPHPQVLYLCEAMLRQHRVQEWKLTNRSGVLVESENLLQKYVFSIPIVQTPEILPLSAFTSSSLNKATDTILQQIHSNDQALCTTLFAALLSVSPPLVNNRDAKGWSPIHHCASTSEPSVRTLDTLYCAGADVALFTDLEHYTALHCFASSDHTKCPSEALYRYIYHLVRDLRAPLSARDKKGNTCIHIAARHGHSIEVLEVLLKCDLSHSVRDLCNAKGLTAWDVAKPEFRIAFGKDAELARPGSSLSTNTLRPVASSLESFLEPDDTFGRRHLSSLPVSDFDLVGAASHLIDNLRISSPSIHHDADIRHLTHLESLVIEIDELHKSIIDHFTARAKQVSDVLKDLESDVQSSTILLDSTTHSVDVKMQELGLQLWKGTRVSEDSELTCVSNGTSGFGAKRKSTLSIPKTIDSEFSDGKLSPLDAEKKSSTSTTSRFVAWIKRKSSANTLSKTLPSPESSKKDVQMQTVNAEEQTDTKITMRLFLNTALQASSVPLETAGRDMDSLRECLVSTKQLLDSACRSISRVDRLLKRASRARKTMISNLHNVEDDLFIRSNSLSAKSSLASIASVSTIASRGSTGNVTSFNDILADSDDEEMKAIRRLLLRKIDAHHNGVLEEIEMAVRWLRAVKDVIQCVKRRTYA